MGSTSFLGFSYPNLLLVFLNLLFFRNLFIYFIFYPYWYPYIVYFICDSASEFGRCPFILDIKFVGRTSRGHTGGRSHKISHPSSFCDACLNFYREKDSAIPFPFCICSLWSHLNVLTFFPP